MIVVLDASTLVSATLKRDSIPERAFLRAVHETNRLLLSQEVEDEYREVIFRPKFDRYASVEHRQRFLDIILVVAETIEPIEMVRECADPKDDKYLTLAVAGKADVIVSSDVRHLVSMHPWAWNFDTVAGEVSRTRLSLPLSSPLPCPPSGNVLT